MECSPLEREREDDVAGAHPVGTEHVGILDDPGGRARHVVLVGLEQAGVLGGLAADERHPRLLAGVGDADTIAAIRSGTTRPVAM